jgi:hypothetical protein
MKIYQLETAKEFLDYWKDRNLSQEGLMQMYAKHVAEKFAAECVNEALGNKMEVSNSLHIKIEKKYNSIIWGESEQNDKENWMPETSSGIYNGYRNKITGEWLSESEYVRKFGPY